ncbi:hypothetical protein GCM10022274_02650 [Brevibacterium ammoniilyticum]
MKDAPNVNEQRTARPGPDAAHRSAVPTAVGSSRHTVRIGSSVAGLSEIAAESDQVQLRVLEATAGIVLERAVRFFGAPLPAGDAPYRVESISAAVKRCTAGDEADSSSTGTEAPHETGGTETAKASSTTTTCPHSSAAQLGPRAGASTDLVHVPRTSTVLAVYDSDFSARVTHCLCPSVAADETVPDAEKQPDETQEPLVEFPEFRLGTDMSAWISDNVPAEDIAETATILGMSIAKAYRHLGVALTIIHGLPRFADRVRAGDFTIAHVTVVADLCRSVAFRYLPEIDEHLAARRADVTSDKLRISLRKRINVLEPPEDRSKTAAERRRVDLHTFKNGGAVMTLTGPADELHACFRRVEAMARAVRSRRGAGFDLPPGVEIVDDRAMDNLMYDIITRPQPKLALKVRTINPVTGLQTVREEPLLDADGNLLFDIDAEGSIVMDSGEVIKPTAGDGRAGVSGAAAGAGVNAQRPPASGSAFSAFGLNEPVIIDSMVVIAMPAHQWWLAMQAGVVVTVPFLSLFGDSKLPGILPDGSPIPAETARRIAGRCSTVTRILTEPATGTPIDAKATTYRIPNNVRKTLIAQWAMCTVPGCPRKAVTSEIDHVDPFFHLKPLAGGLTRFGNLHPLCKRHHALKTAGRLRARMRESGVVEYEFKHGVTTKSRAPDQPIDVAHAFEFAELCGLSPGEVPIPDHLIPPPKDDVEFPPDEEEIRRREEEETRAAAEAERIRRIEVKYQRSQEARRRKRLADLLDWKNVAQQPCLPVGSDPVTMKRLMPARQADPWESARRREEAGDTWTEPLDAFWSKPVQWYHDYTDDPPPF